jgi:DNA (cytosine-5)-methyltransferase 1
MSEAYYNEIDPFAAQWLRNLIKAGYIADGDVDERSIEDVVPNDLMGYTQCHFFAGIGGWSLALRLAGWDDSRPVWTGSCPCQPYSTAGSGKGKEDPRHLYPVWDRLITECKPPVVFGEQVAAAITKGWLDDVYQGLEQKGYTIGSAVLPACSVGSPHRRERLWFVADLPEQRFQERARGEMVRSEAQSEFERRGSDGNVAESELNRLYRATRDETEQGSYRQDDRILVGGSGDLRGFVGDSHNAGLEGRRIPTQRPNQLSPWEAGVEWIKCGDDKYRPVEPSIPLLAHGVSGRMVARRTRQQAETTIQEENWYSRVGALKGFGNAIVPQVAAEFIKAYMECRPENGQGVDSAP